MILLNILVLVFEILYYSMFMYYAKDEGKFKRYLLLFSLITLFFCFYGTNKLDSYLLLIIMIVIGIRLIVKAKIFLFDLFIIFAMLLFNFLLQLPIYTITSLITNNIIYITLILILEKFIFILKCNFLKQMFENIKNKWDKNIFFIRYIFIVVMFLFVISSAIYIIGI